MDQSLKERLVGATVLVVLAVVFIPMLLDDTNGDNNEISGTIIPQKPENEFSSRIIPLEEDVADVKPVVPKEEDIARDIPPDTRQETTTPSAVEVKEQPKLVAEDDKATGLNVGLSAWVVQLGSFSSEANAQALNKKLREAGYPAFVQPIKEKNAVSYRVRVGPELKRSDALTIRDKIKKTMELEGIVISYP